MKNLYEALETFGGRNGRYVARHLEACGIRDFEDCTTSNIAEWVAYLKDKVAPSSARTYVAVFKSTLKRYAESGRVPCGDITEMFRVRAEKPQKVYLTEEELAKLEQVSIKSVKELYAKLSFLISAKTGMRISDTERVTMENVRDGMLTYVSKKTNKEAKVPVSDKVVGWIIAINAIHEIPNLANLELALKRLCKRAGIDTKVKLFRAGKITTKPKYAFVTSHTARVTFCTIMTQKGVPVMDTCMMAGHSTPAMTERYIIRTAPKLNEAALKYLSE